MSGSDTDRAWPPVRRHLSVPDGHESDLSTVLATMEGRVTIVSQPSDRECIVSLHPRDLAALLGHTRAHGILNVPSYKSLPSDNDDAGEPFA